MSLTTLVWRRALAAGHRSLGWLELPVVACIAWPVAASTREAKAWHVGSRRLRLSNKPFVDCNECREPGTGSAAPTVEQLSLGKMIVR